MGSYNDGFTQAVFYALGQAPLGIGILLCNPLAKRFGKRNSILMGVVVSTLGVVLCLVDPRNLVTVLVGQFIRAFGLIPSPYMVSSLLGDALDDVLRHRCAAHRFSTDCNYHAVYETRQQAHKNEQYRSLNQGGAHKTCR